MSGRLHRLLFSVLASLGCVCVGLPAAELPLHEQIDQELAAAGGAQNGPVGARSTDAAFLRRIFLDLAGRIPTAAEARGFLNDPSDTKRERLIDQLIGGSELNRRLQQFFDEMLMERRGDKHVSFDEWRRFLHEKCTSNMPYDQLAREILAADGAEGAQRPAVRFYLDRGAELHGITRDVGRVFFGMDVECAQCHDHPNITGYKQADYYGIHAYLVRSFKFDVKGKKSVFAEKAEGEATFKSVFDKTTGEPAAAAPKLPTGAALEEPTFEKGKEYEVAPAKDVRPVPKFSRRAELARLATTGNKQFNRNIANRLWALVMGRGIVNPVDLHHPDNPPSHPRLLDLLGDAFVAMSYDTKAFLRQLVLTRAYQRSSTPPSAVDADAALAMEARFDLAPLKPIGAEHLAWGVLGATGMIDVHRDAAFNELRAAAKKAAEEVAKKAAEKAAEKAKKDGTSPPPPLPPQPAQLPGRVAVDEALSKKMRGDEGAFVSLFASKGQAVEDFQASVQQALFLNNGDKVADWIHGGRLVPRLVEAKEPVLVADELYLSVLTRYPTAEERQQVVEALTNPADGRATIEAFVWGLLTSVEFRFNH